LVQKLRRMTNEVSTSGGSLDLGVGAPWIFTNIFLILTNLIFLLDTIPCIRAKKYLAAFFFFGTMTASSLHHICKWGSEDVKGAGGWCIPGLTFEMTYAMDFFFSQMMIPIIAAFFINPKTTMTSIEERYPKTIKSHKKENENGLHHSHYYILDFKSGDGTSTVNFLQQQQQDSISAEFGHKIAEPLDFTINMTDAQRVQPNFYGDVKIQNPWVLLYYNPNKHCDLKVLDCSSRLKHSMLGAQQQQQQEEVNGYNSYFKYISSKFGWIMNESHITEPIVSPASDDPSSNIHPEIRCRCCKLNVPLLEGNGYNDDISKLEHSSSHRFAFLDGHYYCNIASHQKERLNQLESFYLLFHVLSIALGLKLVGPSTYNITVPLAVFNLLIIAVLLWVSYGSDVRLYLKKKLILYSNDDCHGAGKAGRNFSDLVRLKKPNKFGRMLWYNFLHCPKGYDGSNVANTDWRTRFILACLPKKTLLGVNMVKSFEWSLGIHKMEYKKAFAEEKKSANTLYVNALTYKKHYAILALLLGLVAVVLFATQNVQPKPIYPGTHGLWHILGGLGVFIILAYVL
jgi:hypothetical protein